MFRFSSLSSQDILLNLTLNGKPLTTAEIDIEKDDLGFYTLNAKTSLKGTLKYVLDVPVERMGWANSIPIELQSIINTIRSFPAEDVDELKLSVDATVAQKLDAMYEQKKGACRHRVAVLIHKFNQLKAIRPQLYDSIRVRAVDRGGVHVNIELSTDNGQSFEVVELGGYKAKTYYLSNKLPALHFSSKPNKEAPKPVFNDVLDRVARSRGQNIFLSLPQSSDMDTCLAHIRNKSSRPIFYVESKEQLQTSLKRLKLNANRTHCEIIDPPAGSLHDFLLTHQHSEPPPIIVINWEHFSPSDIVQFNSVIDTTNRRVDNTPLPINATIVGLHSCNEKMRDLLTDSSFISRHADDGIYDLTSSPLPEIAPEARLDSAQSEPTSLKINLYQSARWHELLIGRAFVNKNQLDWQDGALAQLLHNPKLSQIELVNTPVNDSAFNHFIADLRAGLPLSFLNQTVPIGRPIDVTLSNKRQFASEVKIYSTHSDSLVKDSFIINSSTFEQCLHAKSITEQGLLITQKGLIEAHANGILKLCLSDNLNELQWSLLLDYASTFNVTLDLTLTNGVSLLPGLAYTEKAVEATTEKTANRFIISDDVDYSVLQVQRALSTQAMVIDLSETSLDDLLGQTKYQVTDTGFTFSRKASAVWNALINGETVILKGHCSQEMLHYLASLYSPSPYLYIEGKQHPILGTLIIVANNEISCPFWLTTEQQQITNAEKQSLLDIPLEDSPKHKPFIQLAMEQKMANVPPRVIKEDLTGDSAESALSILSCELFENNRLDAVKHVLSCSPFVVLEGAPGVGKSYFIRALQNNPSFKFYREDEIELWATEVLPSHVQKILFRDEINLRGIDCSQDRDLLNNPPSIFVNGTYYRVSEQCKVMYAQNPLSYGGERQEPQLFKDLPDCKVIFEQMTPAFIVHRILKPIYETTFDSETAKRHAIKTIQDNFSSMRSIRDLQTKAIFECALHRNPIPPQPVVGTKQVCLGLNDFVLTTSRFEPYSQVLTLLQARAFKRELSEAAFEGARFNGVNGLVLQGPPGVGKSEFIESILISEGYSEITKDTSQLEIDKGKVYYRLRASVSNEEKLNILHQAFQQGALLIIDEIDSCPLLEEYLNAYLVGEDIHGKRANKPGFTILSTANGAALKGRRVLPAPLKSRMLALEFDEYSREDLLAIIEGKFISSISSNQALKLEMATFLVDSFLTEQNTNKESPPTFRELYKVAHDYFENRCELYSKLGLSKEHHEFMLVYRNHPHLLDFGLIRGRRGKTAVSKKNNYMKKFDQLDEFIRLK